MKRILAALCLFILGVWGGSLFTLCGLASNDEFCKAAMSLYKKAYNL